MSDPIRELIELIDSTLALTPRTGTDDYPGGVTEGMHIALGIVREKAAALSTTPAPCQRPHVDEPHSRTRTCVDPYHGAPHE